MDGWREGCGTGLGRRHGWEEDEEVVRPGGLSLDVSVPESRSVWMGIWHRYRGRDKYRYHEVAFVLLQSPLL